MLRNILTKTLFEKRWSTLIWLFAIAVFCLLIVVLFPTFKDSFGEALKDTPDSLKTLLGEATDYQNINGYIDIQVVNQMVFLTLIMGVLLGTSLMSGEENSGTLQTLLAQPVSRSRIYWQKFLALSILVFVANAGILAGTLIGALLIGEFGNLYLIRTLLASLMIWLVTLVFSTLAFAVGGITGKKGLSGIVSGFLAFTLYMITSLSGTAEVLRTINNASPFKYFNTPSVMKSGLDIGNLFILTGIIAMLAAIGWYFFTRRDVYQK
jgi:ABC-2 type transport system permease protein